MTSRPYVPARDNGRLQAEADTLARIINVLELENYELRKAMGRRAELVALSGRNDHNDDAPRGPPTQHKLA